MKASEIPPNYILGPDGNYYHSSRVDRALATNKPESNGGSALVREARPPAGCGKGVATGADRKPARLRRAASGQGAVVRVGILCILPRLMDEHDNLRAGCKPLVDAIAASLGVPDNHPGVEWFYGQMRGPVERVIVTIEVHK